MTDPSRRAPLSADVLPASGAWRPGDEPGHRRFLTTPEGRPFALEGGGVLSSVTVAYETWGDLSADASNAILLCHALTGDSHAAGSSGHGHPTEGWWNGLVGPGRAFDTDRYFVVCVNVLGGCQGSTGPSSIDPATGRRYGSTFPVVTIRDMVRTQALVADHLGITQWLAVAGGSMGGMQVLEWGVMFPERVRSLIPIATTLAASAWQIGLSSVQRSTIVLDPKWRGGDYYDAADGDGPHWGLALARQTAHITYQSDPSFERKFGRNEEDPMDEGFTPWQRFSVENYLDYQGAKLVRRFDANSYLVINRAMDLHDVGRGRGGLERAVRRITAPVLTASISSDVLYPPHQQKLLYDMVAENGVRARHVLVESQAGHDGFLIEDAQIAAAVIPFLDEIERRR
jgi:homoserine O-acetyltransferase